MIETGASPLAPSRQLTSKVQYTDVHNNILVHAVSDGQNIVQTENLSLQDHNTLLCMYLGMSGLDGTDG